MSGLNVKEVLSSYREIQAELQRAECWRESMLSQYRTMVDRLDTMEAAHLETSARIDSLIETNGVLTQQNQALLIALGLKALKAMTMPTFVSDTEARRLIGAVG